MTPDILQNPQIVKFLEFLFLWKSKFNLVSKETSDEELKTHIKDCAEIASLIPQNSHVLDIGTGAGFPGLIIAILRPDCTLYLSEINQKKCVFLRHVIQSLQLNTLVREGSVTDLQEEFPVFISRAVCKLDRLLEYIVPLSEQNVPRGTLGIFLKGDHLQEEIQEAEQLFSFKYDIIKGATYQNRQIIQIYNPERKPIER